jgi:hypothetical protein
MGNFIVSHSTLIIENFIDYKDIDLLLESFDSVSFESVSNNPNLFSFQIPNDYVYTSIINKINTKLVSTLEEHYKKQVSHYTSGSIIRYKQDQFIGPHADWEPEDPYVKNFNKKKVDISSIIYLNENFIGGELIFCENKNLLKNKLLTLLPKKGLVIFFDSLKYHYTDPIISGSKYSYTNFYSLKD